MTATTRLRACVLALAVLGLGPLAPAARADSITFINGFGASGPAKLVDFDAFDPALGTLDSVFVQIMVTAASATVFAPPLEVAPGVFAAYQVTLALDVAFEGLAGQFFEFGAPGHMTATAVGFTPGSGEVLVVPFAPFGLDFTIDATSDLVGGFDIPVPAGAVPPTTVNALRSDFVLDVATIESLLATQSVRVVGSTGPVPIAQFSTMAGALTVTYHYTPRPVPEPRLAVLASVGAVMSLRRRVRPRR